MVRSRTATAIVGLAVSLLISVAAWYYFHTLILFLFVPFVPILLRRSTVEGRQPQSRECSVCGFSTVDPAYDYCPQDGTPLE